MLLMMGFQTLFILVMMHSLKKLMPIVSHFSNAEVSIDFKDKETVIYQSELQLMKKRTRLSK